MRILTFFLALLFCANISAQEESNSLQASLNKAIKKNQTEPNYLQANLDPSSKAVQLKWTGEVNKEAKAYVIEKSTDKLDWQEIATVYNPTHKTNQMDYFHMDYTPLQNLSYYRIVMNTPFGKKVISNVVPVNNVELDGNMAGTNLFPILSEDKLIVNIAFEEIFEKEILIVIRDKDGNEFYSKVFINIEDEHLVAVPIEREVPKGDYLITATSENQIYSQNIIIK